MLDGGFEEGDELGLALVADGVEGSLLGGGGVLGEGAEEGDVLGFGAFVIFELGEGRDEAAAEEGYVVFAIGLREIGVGGGGLDLGEVEGFEAGGVVGFGVAAGDDGEDLRVVRGLRQQGEGELAGLGGVVCVVGAGGGLEGEGAGEGKIARGGGFGGVEQGGDGEGGLVGAGVEVCGGADDAEQARVGGVDGRVDGLGLGGLFAGFERGGEGVLELDFLDGIDGEGGLAGEGGFVGGGEGVSLVVFLGKGADGFCFVFGLGAGQGGGEERRDFGAAVLRGEDVGAKGERGGGGGVGGEGG